MASNPKYAELPGFAHDQPDVYESEDLPEAEQVIADLIDDSESVEVLHVSMRDAFNRFKSCRIDGSRTDFTEGPLPRKKRGFDVIYGDWELSDDRENESLPERYHRIKSEVKQFLEDVAAIETEKRPENHEVLLADMEMLEKLLADINLEAIMGENGYCPDKSIESTKRLLGHLDALKSEPDFTSSPVPKGHENTGNKTFTYELFYKPEYNKLQQAQQVAALEARIRQLEATVGVTASATANGASKLTVLPAHANTAGRSLQDACDELSSKLYLLDPGNIERVTCQLSSLQDRLRQVSERRSAIEDAQKNEKVAQMYEVSRKVDQLLPDLTNILETLSSLQQLHEQALHFSKCITMLEGQSNLLSGQLKGDEELLKEIQRTLERDLLNTTQNIAKLEVRMNAFKQ